VTTRNILTLIFLSIFSISCDQLTTSFTPKETFTVVHNEETMPVWVYGKSDAPYILLAAHGGPGSDVLDFRNYQNGVGFKKIEESYLVAYWQQRASGQSKGSNNTKYFTISQYVEDLDVVINELKTRYPSKGIVLLGHSWGGTLTSAYLKDLTRRTKVVAWIDAAGLHNGTIFSSSTRNDLIREADLRIAANQNTSYWQDVKNKAQNTSTPLTEINSLAYGCLNNIPEVVTKVNLADFKHTQRALTSNGALFPEILTSNNTSGVSTLTIPVLLLWGKYDFAVSKQLRDELMGVLPPAKLTSVTMQASGHYMMFHEPELFASYIKQFMDKL